MMNLSNRFSASAALAVLIGTLGGGFNMNAAYAQGRFGWTVDTKKSTNNKKTTTTNKKISTNDKNIKTNDKSTVTDAVVLHPHDLTPSQVSEAFTGFNLVREGNNYRVFGVVFSDCSSLFVLKPSDLIGKGTNGKDYRGLRVHDTGGGLACVAVQKKKIKDCGASINITPECTFGADKYKQLSEPGREGNVITLSDDQLVNIGLETIDPSLPENAPRFSDIPGQGEVVHVGSKIIAKQEHDKEVERLTKLVNCVDCKNDPEQLQIAKGALDSLIGSGDFKGDGAAIMEKLNKQIADAEIKKNKADFAKMIKGIASMSADDLEALRADLLEQAAVPPTGLSPNDYAAAMHAIAVRYTNDKSLGLDGYTLALQTIEEAKGIEGLTEVNQNRLTGYVTDIRVAEVSAIAEQGVYGNGLLKTKYRSLMKDLKAQRKIACRGKTASIEACGSATQALQTVSMIPQQAQMAQQQRYMEQMQEMQSANNPSYGVLPGYSGNTFGATQGNVQGNVQGEVQFNQNWQPTAGAGNGVFNPSTNPAALWGNGNSYGINNTF